MVRKLRSTSRCTRARGIGHAVHGVDLGVVGSVSRQRGVGLGTVPVTQLDADYDAAGQSGQSGGGWRRIRRPSPG
jgi:hypothetical protein